MEDIVPSLLNDIKNAFNREMLKSPVTRTVQKAIKNGKVTYADAYRYSRAVGNARAKAFKVSINSGKLPEGKMYFNIADRIIRETLPEDYKAITEVTAKAQQRINKNMKVGLKNIKPSLDEDKLEGFINRLSSEGLFDDVAWILEDPIRQFCMSAVDDSIKSNADFQSKVGIKPIVTRESNGKCCEWCNSLVGVYQYPDVPKEVWARHDNCTCTITYNGEEM